MEEKYIFGKIAEVEVSNMFKINSNTCHKLKLVQCNTEDSKQLRLKEVVGEPLFSFFK